jgi:hypothetical protein
MRESEVLSDLNLIVTTELSMKRELRASQLLDLVTENPGDTTAGNLKVDRSGIDDDFAIMTTILHDSAGRTEGRACITDSRSTAAYRCVVSGHRVVCRQRRDVATATKRQNGQRDNAKITCRT